VCVFDGTYYKITTTNYISKTSIYHIPHVSIRTLANENLDVCTACDLWDSNIQLTMGKDRRWQIYVGFVADVDIKWGAPPLGPSMPFLDSDTCAEGGGYLFLPGFSSLYDAIHGWMTGWMDGWKASRKRTTTSFTICNISFVLFFFQYCRHTYFFWLLV
jgi:hypothetical protein